jgi:hypothetical protein
MTAHEVVSLMVWWLAIVAIAVALTSTLSGRGNRILAALRGQHYNWEITDAR